MCSFVEPTSKRCVAHGRQVKPQSCLILDKCNKNLFFTGAQARTELLIEKPAQATIDRINTPNQNMNERLEEMCKFHCRRYMKKAIGKNS
jgi:hypothetical protein